ncbi:hypothetical protein, partial [Xanthomonas euvesicatoria]|uniref:hypothetical protein n=1 Tax=Xanthomonas euvesicatoria TaxID=456327 RepID=UPI001C47BE82
MHAALQRKCPLIVGCGDAEGMLRRRYEAMLLIQFMGGQHAYSSIDLVAPEKPQPANYRNGFWAIQACEDC